MKIVLVLLLIAGISLVEIIQLARAQYWKETGVYISITLVSMILSAMLLRDIHATSPADVIEQIIIKIFALGGGGM